MTGPRAEDEPQREMWPDDEEGEEAYLNAQHLYDTAVDNAIERDWERRHGID